MLNADITMEIKELQMQQYEIDQESVMDENELDCDD